MIKFTKDELNMMFLAFTGIVHPETSIIEDLRKQDKIKFQKIMVKLNKILEAMDENEADKALN